MRSNWHSSSGVNFGFTTNGIPLRRRNVQKVLSHDPFNINVSIESSIRRSTSRSGRCVTARAKRSRGSTTCWMRKRALDRR
jgi:hypothetical protein